MKKLLVLSLLLTGCAHVSYENGDTSVSYSTLFKDIESINAKVNENTSVSVGNSSVNSQAVTLPLSVLQKLLVP